MATSTLISDAVTERPTPAYMLEEEYLRTSYRPDCDYVEGRVEERNAGEYGHSRVQFMLLRIFGNREREWRVATAPECRLQVRPDRYRVPDVMVLRRGRKVDRIVREAPLICIEVLSPEDTWAKLRERLDDYLAMGVEHVWCFEPEAREVRRYTAQGFDRVTTGELVVEGTAIRVGIAEVFSVLDEDDGE